MSKKKKDKGKIRNYDDSFIKTSHKKSKPYQKENNKKKSSYLD